MRRETIGNCTLYLGNSLDVLPEISGIHACVTDPPYELGFMGKGWDASGIANSKDLWRKVLAAILPGAHLLAFGGSRTYHRMTCAIEDAGFEIRDQIMWLYGSGFPKSHNLDGERNGWGTALKPAHEPIAFARKALTGTVAANVLVYGAGAINIDGCRVAVDASEVVEDDGRRTNSTCAEGYQRPNSSMFNTGKTAIRGGPSNAEGRWPANVIHDGSDEVLSAFPDAPGQQGDIVNDPSRSKTQNVYGAMKRGEHEYSADRRYTAEGGTNFAMKPGARRNDTGSAARFYYCAKASKRDRDEGLTTPEQPVVTFQTANGTSGKPSSISEGRDTAYRNNHPTVKPTDLMRYLCRLVTPPGGIVLDPFMGSGSTGKAAVLEGFSFVGIEQDAGYFDIACCRVEAAYRRAGETVEKRSTAVAQAERRTDFQLNLFAEISA